MREKRFGKRCLTWVLVLMMTLSLLPVSALAEDGEVVLAPVAGVEEEEAAPVEAAPMPSEPVKASTSPGRSSLASASPMDSVSCALCDKNCIASPPDPILTHINKQYSTARRPLQFLFCGKKEKCAFTDG